MTDSNTFSSLTKKEFYILILIALFALVIHCYTNVFAGYGYFRDELYYLACSEHLDAGYVDHPPLSIVMLTFSRLLFGDSLFALRLLPSVIHVINIILIGIITKELGGELFAITLSAIAVAVCPVALAMTNYYSMNSFDALFWTIGAFLFLRLIKTGRPNLWLILGIVLGLGMLNKISVMWLGAGIAAGLLSSPYRKYFLTKYPYIAGGIALVLFSPFIIWNVTHDFAHLEFIRNASGGKYSSLTPLIMIKEMFLQNNPLTTPLWLIGLYFFFFTDSGRPYRPFGFIFVIPFIILVINWHSKAEYLAPSFVVLFSGGSVMLERIRFKQYVRWLKPVYVSLILSSGIALAPLVIPVLPVETYIRYAASLGMKPSSSETKELAELPQHYADMFGWEEKTKAVADVFHSLSEDEQKKCALFADNYGRCAAIDFFGAKYGLPKSIGRHNNYWIWGPRSYTGELVIILGGDLEHKQQVFESVVIAGTVSTKYCMPYENNLNIYLCRKLNVPFAGLWAQLKHYD